MKPKSWLLLVTFFLAVLLLMAGTASGQDEYSNPGALLDLGRGARPMGMGGAFIGLADDENAVYYNPAALGFLDEFGVTTLWSPQFGFLDYGGIGFARKYVGLSTSALYSGSIAVPNEFGADTGTSFSYLSGNGVLGFGFPLLSQLSLGGKARYYYSHLTLDSSEDGYGWSVDPAIIAKGENFGLGIMVENALTGGLVYGSNHREELERKLRAGISFSSRIDRRMKLNVLADLEAPLDSVAEANYELITPHLGIELWLSGVGVRAGYNGRALTVGSSLEITNLRLDWALSAYQSGLTETHRVSLIYRF
ncbi:MAG: hypothetical protein V5A87_02905 [Candidatus Bipolaricaulota bacterium]|nr:hypothetical protein [Candidatus Bipolaricaulota bacterium]MBS3791709.1 hypothetical protein [Candidatus Bipolaricaulota bacterium]